MGASEEGTLQPFLTREPDSRKGSVTYSWDEIPDQVCGEIRNRVATLQTMNVPPTTEVELGEIELALENMDDRRDHRRAMDAGVERSMDLIDEMPYDVVLTEVEYDLGHLKNDIEDLLGYRPSEGFFRGEIDMLLLDSESNWMEGIEFKPRRGSMIDSDGRYIPGSPTHQEKAEKQRKRRVEQMSLVSEVLDNFDFVYREGFPVFETDLNPLSEMPDHWSGRNYNGEKLKEVSEYSESVRALLENFVLPENPGILGPEKEFEKVKEGEGDFLREKAEDLYKSY